MSSAEICTIEPFRYQSTPVPGDAGPSGNQINEQALEDYLNRMRVALCDDIQALINGGGGATTFLQLTDTPDSYSGQAGKAVAVKGAEDGLEFVDFPTPPASEGLFTPRMILIGHPDADGAGATCFGSGQPATGGTFGTNNPGTTAGGFAETYPRASFASTAVAGQSAFWRTQTGSIWRGDAARRGGFRFICRVGTQTAVAQQRAFFGIKVPGAIGNVQPSTLVNCIGLAYDSAETTLRIQHNDGAGNCTRVDLGANFPVNATALYQLELEAPANGGDVTYTVTNLETGNTTTGTLSSDLPVSTTFMEVNLWVNNGTTAASALGVFTFVYAENAV